MTHAWLRILGGALCAQVSGLVRGSLDDGPFPGREIPHDADEASCKAAYKVFAETGSHYLTHADFGCADGIHNAWFVIEADDHDEARLVAPPAYRNNTRVTKVKQYAMTELDAPHADQ